MTPTPTTPAAIARGTKQLYTVRIVADDHTHYVVRAESPAAAIVAAKRLAIADMVDDVGDDGQGTYSVIAGRVANGGLGFAAAALLTMRADEVQS